MQVDALISEALKQANLLKRLLDQEFDALKSQELDLFESLQSQKLEILTFLGSESLAEKLKQGPKSSSESAATIASWDNIIEIIRECREMHRRNQILINRKIESVKGALQTIQSPGVGPSIDVYDRLGKIKSPRSSRGFRKA
jgi:flagellar biosynthesis/type III secretory pathway chaperone